VQMDRVYDSDHRVAGSSPAGCNAKDISNLDVIFVPQNGAFIVRLLPIYPPLIFGLAVRTRDPFALPVDRHGQTISASSAGKLFTDGCIASILI
jgi:hypothetical protein